MCLLEIHNGQVFIDQDMYDTLSKYKWYKDQSGYAARSQRVYISKGKYSCKKIYMHREILKTDLTVDHINGNKLDNRANNLREATRQQQSRNRNSSRNSTSKYVGVHYHKVNRKWRSQIRIDNKTVEIGSFATQEQAYEARLNYIVSNNLERFKRV